MTPASGAKKCACCVLTTSIRLTAWCASVQRRQKARRERVVPYSAATGQLLRAYLTERQSLNPAAGALFLSASRRNRARPITLWTWSKVVQGIARRAGITQFSTHTLRHL